MTLNLTTSISLNGYMNLLYYINSFLQSTALDVAAHFGNPCIVRVLLDHGASVTNKSVFGMGCLEAAISGSKEETCMEIVKHNR